MPDNTALLDSLADHTRAIRDRHPRRGFYEYHIACPECRHVSSPKEPHCSFSERGWKCFSCGASGSLRGLMKLVGLDDAGGRKWEPAYIPDDPEPPKLREWMLSGESVLKRMESHLFRFALWGQYKPVSVENIKRLRLGVGVLPSSRCKHERLTVPVFDNGRLVGLRGRALNCDCGKWLSSGGTSPETMPLYGIDDAKPGGVIWICENCIDAALITQQGEFFGVASYSVSYWKDHWTESLLRLSPEYVMIAYDNDLPGNGGGRQREKFIREWKKDPRHENSEPPPAAGIRLWERLRAAGLRADVYDWGYSPYKADIGTMLQEDYASQQR